MALMVLKYRNDPTKLKEELEEVNKVYIKIDLVDNDDDSFSRCKTCNIVVHQASYAKRLRS